MKNQNEISIRKATAPSQKYKKLETLAPSAIGDWWWGARARTHHQQQQQQGISEHRNIYGILAADVR